MGQRAIKPIEKLAPNITLATMPDGLWLYDFDVGMNLAMRAKDEREAILTALLYYKRRFNEYRSCYECLKARVDDFVSDFLPEEEERIPT